MFLLLINYMPSLGFRDAFEVHFVDVYNLKVVTLTEFSLTLELRISNIILVSQKFVFLMYPGESLLTPWFLLVYRTVHSSETKVLHGLVKLLCGLWILTKPFDVHVYEVMYKCKRIIKLSTKGSVKIKQFLLPSKLQRAVYHLVSKQKYFNKENDRGSIVVTTFHALLWQRRAGKGSC